jgi:hypothetical protein
MWKWKMGILVTVDSCEYYIFHHSNGARTVKMIFLSLVLAVAIEGTLFLPECWRAMMDDAWTCMEKSRFHSLDIIMWCKFCSRGSAHVGRWFYIYQIMPMPALVALAVRCFPVRPQPAFWAMTKVYDTTLILLI